jgi:hypothetical protein
MAAKQLETKNCMEQCPWKAFSRLGAQEYPNILWTPKVRFHVNKDPRTLPYSEPDQSSLYNPIIFF